MSVHVFEDKRGQTGTRSHKLQIVNIFDCLFYPGGTSGQRSTWTAADEIVSDKEHIEKTLNLANNGDLTWTYTADAEAWTMSIVTAVVNPELPGQQGVSVCVPGVYVTGVDTDGDGAADVTAENYSEAVNGVLVIDYEAEITSTNGQVYTAATAPSS